MAGWRDGGASGYLVRRRFFVCTALVRLERDGLKRGWVWPIVCEGDEAGTVDDV